MLLKFRYFNVNPVNQPTCGHFIDILIKTKTYLVKHSCFNISSSKNICVFYDYEFIVKIINQHVNTISVEEKRICFKLMRYLYKSIFEKNNNQLQKFVIFIFNKACINLLVNSTENENFAFLQIFIFHQYTHDDKHEIKHTMKHTQ